MVGLTSVTVSTETNVICIVLTKIPAVLIILEKGLVLAKENEKITIVNVNSWAKQK